MTLGVLGVFGALGTGRFLAILGDSWLPPARITGGIAGGIIGGTASRPHTPKHAKISNKLASDPPKSSPEFSKIEAGALQDAILNKHLT